MAEEQMQIVVISNHRFEFRAFGQGIEEIEYRMRLSSGTVPGDNKDYNSLLEKNLF